MYIVALSVKPPDLQKDFRCTESPAIRNFPDKQIAREHMTQLNRNISSKTFVIARSVV